MCTCSQPLDVSKAVGGFLTLSAGDEPGQIKHSTRMVSLTSVSASPALQMDPSSLVQEQGPPIVQPQTETSQEVGNIVLTSAMVHLSTHNTELVRCH